MQHMCQERTHTTLHISSTYLNTYVLSFPLIPSLFISSPSPLLLPLPLLLPFSICNKNLLRYSLEDQNERHRLIKYTPDHMHCTATMYGPIAPPNTGVLAFQSVGTDLVNFRVSGTGVILELDESFRVTKKLKLVGTPYKVHKNTAFIQGMFNSDLEVR